MSHALKTISLRQRFVSLKLDSDLSSGRTDSKIISLTSNRSVLLLHEEAILKAKAYRKSEKELLEVLLRVEQEKIYHQFELTSLFSYCVDLLGLSRASACDFIQVMRKGVEVPELLEAIYQDKTTVSKARKICSVLNLENAKEWIDLVIHCSSRTVEKAVAQKNPRSQVPESLKYISHDTLELKLAISKEGAELLEQIKDLVSQKKGKAVSSEEALIHIMKEYHERHDPVVKAKRALHKKATRILSETNSNSVRENPSLTEIQRYIPADVKHRVYDRDQGQCSYVFSSGKKCSSKRWLDIHHIQPFANGGAHHSENLEILCRAHHLIKHKTELVT